MNMRSIRSGQSRDRKAPERLTQLRSLLMSDRPILSLQRQVAKLAS